MSEQTEGAPEPNGKIEYDYLSYMWEGLARLNKIGEGRKNARKYSEDELIEMIGNLEPGVKKFVREVVNEAETPEEAYLAAETAYVLTNAFTHPVSLTSEDPDSNSLESSGILAGIEKSIEARKKDNNSIYHTLQEDMDDDPELAAHIASIMRDSLTLEEANLIGRAALVAYHAARTKAK